jgi:hypothetical protein
MLSGPQPLMDHEAVIVNAIAVDRSGDDPPDDGQPRAQPFLGPFYTLHSKWLRHSPTRGGLTTFDGMAVRRAASSNADHRDTPCPHQALNMTSSCQAAFNVENLAH